MEEKGNSKFNAVFEFENPDKISAASSRCNIV